ncbi:MAG: DNA alkylation repair protein [Ignavibacteriae bacterium]|nr:DNA alkylation repair protein [Ignavibacteriota bacterium]
MSKEFSVDEIIKILRHNKNPKNVEGMAKFGINPEFALGISMPFLRNLGKQIGKNHNLAIEFWKTKIHEAQILATIIDDPKLVTKSQMNSWVKDFNSWDLCDQCCMNLFRKSEFAFEKSLEWLERKEEFVKRAGFALAATLAVHSKYLTNEDFEIYLQKIIEKSDDERNFVKKAVNWALRQIGKRNIYLNKKAIEVSEKLINSKSKSAKWIGKDALKELTSEKILVRIS